jgi:hypothetical protein
MRSDGVLIGRIVHIEAAKPGGPRFRASMTNEERRSFENLMLMCGTHHDVVDADLEHWTVRKLHDLKKEHEATYSGAVDQLRGTIGDVTEGTSWRSATNLRKLDVAGQTAEEIAWSIEVLDDLAARLAAIPLAARSLLALIAIRGGVRDMAAGEIAIPAFFLEKIADCSRSELYNQINVLEHAGFALVDEPFESAPEVVIRSTPREVGWPVFADLSEIAGGDPALIRQVVIDLDFTAFDE